MSVEGVEWGGTLPAEEDAAICEGSGDDALESAGDSAEGRGWGKGWPHCQTKRLSTVVVTKKLRLGVRHEIAPLVGWLCEETIRRGYHLHSGQCWGFACRAIRGSSSPSNHSWGLAVDLNSLANPMGATLVTDMPGWMRELWTDHGFRWGGSYHGRKDAMHFEFMGSPAQAQHHISRLGGHATVPAQSVVKPAGKPATPRPVPPFPLPAGHFFGMTGPEERRHDGSRAEDRPHVERIQRCLQRRSFELGPHGVDGRFGPKAQAAVETFQRRHDLEVDGLVGPTTWAGL